MTGLTTSECSNEAHRMHWEHHSLLNLLLKYTKVTAFPVLFHSIRGFWSFSVLNSQESTASGTEGTWYFNTNPSDYTVSALKKVTKSYKSSHPLCAVTINPGCPYPVLEGRCWALYSVLPGRKAPRWKQCPPGWTETWCIFCRLPGWTVAPEGWINCFGYRSSWLCWKCVKVCECSALSPVCSWTSTLGLLLLTVTDRQAGPGGVKGQSWNWALSGDRTASLTLFKSSGWNIMI